MNKVVRLPDGRFITRKLVVSSPEDVLRASQDEIWQTSDGRQIVAKDMELKHLMNAIFFMEKEATQKLQRLGFEEPNENLERVKFKAAFDKIVRPQYFKLREELEIRLGKKQREKPAEEPTKRCFNFD